MARKTHSHNVYIYIAQSVLNKFPIELGHKPYHKKLNKIVTRDEDIVL